MAIYLKVVDGVARNAAEVDDPNWAAAQPETWILASGGAGRGWSWDGSSWSAPVQSDAELAATLSLRAPAFFQALDEALGLTTSDPLAPDYVAAQISASSTLTATEKRQALTLLASATEFLRADPNAPGLLDAVGAELGLTSAQIDAMFLSAGGAA
ncbi:MAG: hypothetical protein MRY74_05785 [Neomegalonema sp.]|nr:hypothetical protein [Neomegalonema sp.]